MRLSSQYICTGITGLGWGVMVGILGKKRSTDSVEGALSHWPSGRTFQVDRELSTLDPRTTLPLVLLVLGVRVK